MTLEIDDPILNANPTSELRREPPFFLPDNLIRRQRRIDKLKRVAFLGQQFVTGLEFFRLGMCDEATVDRLTLADPLMDYIKQDLNAVLLRENPFRPGLGELDQEGIAKEVFKIVDPKKQEQEVLAKIKRIDDGRKLLAALRSGEITDPDQVSDFMNFITVICESYEALADKATAKDLARLN